MGRNYFRHMDDTVSDPEAIAARYQLGQNAFFEIALTLAEMNENARAAGGGGASSATSIETATGGGDYSTFSRPCPREDQYIWICDAQGENIRPVLVSHLADTHDRKPFYLYNPLTKNGNRLVSAEYHYEQRLVRFETGKGASVTVSRSHKVIRNTGDLVGTKLLDIDVGNELLTCFKEKQGRENVHRVYLDQLEKIEDAGIGTVVKVSLETEWIYMTGEEKDCGTLAHNLKRDPDLEPTV